jgi:endonuclease VIII
MPEGPSIVILREEAAKFEGKVVRRVEGNSSLELDRMLRKKVLSLRTWGKHFLIEFAGFSMRVHLLMFGTYCIDSRKPGKTPRMALGFANGELVFYTSSLKWIEGDLDDTYDWSGDVLSDAWSPRKARNKLMKKPGRLICDALLDQEIFAGVGNIIRNEVMHRTGVHPESTIGALPSRKLGEIIRQARDYSFDFLAWKKAYVLRKHWRVHKQRACKDCDGPVSKSYPGTSARRCFFCENCQPRYQ